jgi:quinol monooxygenase YgiN
MVDQQVRIRVSVTVHDGQLESFKRVAQEMVAATEAEPGTTQFEWFGSADGTSFTLLETYADAQAVEAHFTGPVVKGLVPKLVAVVSFTSYEIYGDPGEKVTEMALRSGAVILPYLLGMSR